MWHRNVDIAATLALLSILTFGVDVLVLSPSLSSFCCLPLFIPALFAAECAMRCCVACITRYSRSYTSNVLAHLIITFDYSKGEHRNIALTIVRSSLVSSPIHYLPCIYLPIVYNAAVHTFVATSFHAALCVFRSSFPRQPRVLLPLLSVAAWQLSCFDDCASQRRRLLFV